MEFDGFSRSETGPQTLIVTLVFDIVVLDACKLVRSFVGVSEDDAS